MSNPCLYVFVNTDIESMNFGKAMAQSSHCSNAFVDECIYQPGLLEQNDGFYTPTERAAIDWYYSTKQGFGTQSNLKAVNFYTDKDDLRVWAKDNGYMFGVVTDPTYPFEVSREIFRLLKDSSVKSVRVKDNGMVLCTRSEETAFYVFGDRDDVNFKDHMLKWKLHP